jgi:hypothetical protein
VRGSCQFSDSSSGIRTESRAGSRNQANASGQPSCCVGRHAGSSISVPFAASRLGSPEASTAHFDRSLVVVGCAPAPRRSTAFGGKSRVRYVPGAILVPLVAVRCHNVRDGE